MASFEKELNRSPGPEGLSNYRKVEERLDILGSRIEELMKLITLKTERLSVKQRMIDERQDEMAQDFQKRLMAILTKSADLPKIELKIQELLERQNQVVRNFDNRMNHFRKVVETQEVQLFKALAELDESRREIARLKRG
jgi:hypothetical protein